MKTYTEFFERLQGEFLSSLKQAQELNLKTLASMTALDIPTPTQVVDRAFAFSDEFLATRKEYMVKLAELATQAQQQ